MAGSSSSSSSPSRHHDRPRTLGKAAALKNAKDACDNLKRQGADLQRNADDIKRLKAIVATQKQDLVAEKTAIETALEKNKEVTAKNEEISNITKSLVSRKTKATPMFKLADTIKAQICAMERKIKDCEKELEEHQARKPMCTESDTESELDETQENMKKKIADLKAKFQEFNVESCEELISEARKEGERQAKAEIAKEQEEEKNKDLTFRQIEENRAFIKSQKKLIDEMNKQVLSMRGLVKAREENIQELMLEAGEEMGKIGHIPHSQLIQLRSNYEINKKGWQKDMVHLMGHYGLGKGGSAQFSQQFVKNGGSIDQEGYAKKVYETIFGDVATPTLGEFKPKFKQWLANNTKGFV